VSHFASYAPTAHGTRDPAVEVRDALEDDVPAIAAVARTRGGEHVGLEGRLAGWVRGDEHVVLVATRHDEVIGWASARRLRDRPDAPDGWYVSSLTVAPQHRRRGAGDALLTRLVAHADARESALRSIVNATNAPSLDLHAAHGFVEEGRGPTFAGIEFIGGTGVLLVRKPPISAAGSVATT